MITGTLLTIALASTTATGAEEPGGLQHSISIYGWLPTFDGTMKYTIPGGGPGGSDESGESDFVDKIDMVLMGSYEVRSDQWSFLADAIYLKMSDSQEVTLPLIGGEIGSDQELETWLLSFYGGYNVLDTGNASLDVIGGLRYLYLGLDATFSVMHFTTPSISPSVELYDGVIGVKGYVNLTENWYVPYLFDIGGGDSDLTWQAEASIGYRFDWGDILATYRYVHYDKGDAGLIDEVDLYGPKVGLVFRF